MSGETGLFSDAEASSENVQAQYLVLARKYRPTVFEDLLGQDVLVRTLTNAFGQGRIAHAFLFVGVRGVGKTTAARIVARGLNCMASSGPTVRPCGECDSCKAALVDRHLDILEIDAASHTGVDDVREITDAGRYRPSMGRYKVYIVDEVHMLSTSAFNALLKTLEEPPEHLIFIFCTTEFRKVPVTVLSRCQRFDLPRIPHATLVEHYGRVAKAEEAMADDEALAMIARAADGSVRDGLSILDQAISYQAGSVTAEATREMLGLADRSGILDLFGLLMVGKTASALARLEELFDAGADPLVVLEDLLGVAHRLSRIKAGPEGANAPKISDSEAARAKEIAEKLSVPTLGRAWQMLLKVLDEARQAPDARSAAEMGMIRLCHVADLPDPAALVRQLADTGTKTPTTGAAFAGTPPSTALDAPEPARPRAAGAQVAAATQVASPDTDIKTFEDLLAYLGERRETVLQHALENYIHLVDFMSGHIKIRPAKNAPRGFVNDLSSRLREKTGMRWIISIVKEGGAPPVREQRRQAEEKRKQAFLDGSRLATMRKVFPKAQLKGIRPTGATLKELDP